MTPISPRADRHPSLRPVRNGVVLGVLLAAVSSAVAAQTRYTVDTAGDGADANPGDGICADAAGACSLRAAIEESNAVTGTTDTIHFNIPGAVPHTIQPDSVFEVTDPVVIDGYTQPGAAANTNPLGMGSNAVLAIEIDGTTTANVPTRSGLVLSIASDSTLIRGLVVNRGRKAVQITTGDGITLEGNLIGTDVTGTMAMRNISGGIELTSNAGNVLIGGTSPAARNVISGNYIGITMLRGTVVQGNYIGTDITGTVAIPNTYAGIRLPYYTGSALAQIGGTAAGAGNLISGNGGFGVYVEQPGSVVQGNLIGTDVTGANPLGNAWSGLQVQDYGVVIGGIAAGAANTIAFNGDAGIRLGGGGITPSSTVMLGNHIHSNGGLGIDNYPDGVNLNDAGDADNLNQNFPVVAMAYPGGAEGLLNSVANTQFTLAFYVSTSCDPSGYGEGADYVGSGSVTTDGSGNAPFAISFATPIQVGDVVTATASDPANQTSEFSMCVTTVAQPSYTVTSTDDADDGLCDPTHCSLREALLAANGNPGPNDIKFNIPGTGPHTIQVLSLLPPITDPVTIDGYTQSGSIPNTNPLALGSNATIQIEIVNVNRTAGVIGRGFDVQADDTTIRGVVMSEFQPEIGSDLPGTVVEGSFFDTDVTGLQPAPLASGIYLSGGRSRAGGPAPAQRNILGGRLGVAGNANVVQGNLVGVDATGQQPLLYNGTNRGQVLLTSGDSSVVGGSADPDEGNVIGGGILLQVANHNTIQGNHVGTDVTGTVDLGHSGHGVQFGGPAASDNLLGGTVSGAGNVIAFNDGAGVYVETYEHNAILGNSIRASGGLGIDLGAGSPDGITPNDAGDGDTGPNHLQNFAVLSAAWLGDSALTVEGMLNSTATTTFRVEFFANTACHATGYGEGERYLGFANVTTDGAGDVSFAASLSDTAGVGQSITATATDPDDNTSEFSACVSGVGFATAAEPTGLAVVRGDSADYAITVRSLGGTFDQDLTLTCENLPADTACHFAPGSVNPGADSATAVLTVSTTNPDTPTGVLPFTIVASNGAVHDTTSASLTVTDFTIAVSPDTAQVQDGASATYSVDVDPDGPEFGQPVSLACTGLPAGASCGFSPATVTPGTGGATAVLTLSTAALSAAAASYPEFPVRLAGLGWMLAGTLGLMFAAITRRQWHRLKRRHALIGVSVLASVSVAACSPAEIVEPPPTPVTTTFTVTATAGNLTHSAPVTVIVH